jgi:hypothetical protein
MSGRQLSRQLTQPKLLGRNNSISLWCVICKHLELPLTRSGLRLDHVYAVAISWMVEARSAIRAYFPGGASLGSQTVTVSR